MKVPESTIKKFVNFRFDMLNVAGGRGAVRASHCKGLPINCYQCLEGCEKITKKSAVGTAAARCRSGVCVF
jgi:hypothetical protein